MLISRRRSCCALFLFALPIWSATRITFAEVPPTAERPWRALHVINYTTDAALTRLGEQLPKLADMGLNCLILEVNYGFEFNSHPELRQGERQISKAGAKKLLAICREHQIELVPQFMCLGHQSWSGNTFPLLTNIQSWISRPARLPTTRVCIAANGIR